MIIRPCDLCGTSIRNNTGRYPRACGTIHVKLIEEDTPLCWLKHGNEIKTLCVKTLQDIDPRKKHFETIRPLLRRLGETCADDQTQLKVYFGTLTVEERHILLDYAHPELKKILMDNLSVQLTKKGRPLSGIALRDCDFCDAPIKNLKGHMPRSCATKYCVSIPKHHPDCWLHKGNEIKTQCVVAAGNIDPRHVYGREAVTLLKHLGELSPINKSEMDSFLAHLTPQERFLLVKYATPELKVQLTGMMAEGALPALQPIEKVSIPDVLPEGLKQVLNDFKEALERRYDRLVKLNHHRNAAYLRRELAQPISLCTYLAKEGFTSWDGVSQMDVVNYLQSKDKFVSNNLRRFVRFTEKKRNPFRKKTFGQPRRNGSVLIQTPRPRIVAPEQLESFIQSLKEHVSEYEYALAWFVCKMGLTAERAYSFTLADFEINDKSRCVVRPATAWVQLPRNIEQIVTAMANKVLPGWQHKEEQIRKHYPLFDSFIPSLRNFTVTVLQKRSKVLRSSALYAMMMKGHLDRVTLISSTGVSTPTLAKLERLFSADVHRRLDPDFIKLRNTYIIGEPKKNE